MFMIILALLFMGGSWGEGGLSTITSGFSDDATGLDLEEVLPSDISLPETNALILAELALDPTSIPISIDVPDWTPSSNDISDGGYGQLPQSGIGGRTQGNRRRLALLEGGSRESEEAVELGLAWLAAHQFHDGSWHFDFREAPNCQGQCGDHGSLTSTNAATGLALLSFLGAGYTHREGPYQEVVNRGLYYLTSRLRPTQHGGELRDDLAYGMYCHAIATLALCEAYAMTEDPHLEQIVQRAVDYIVYAQHEGGGWRYGPREPGDTTVTGWQVITLKSALLAEFQVPSPVWHGVDRFLNQVGSDRGAFYGYMRAGREPTNTAIGLLCRMMLGWDHDNSSLYRGVTYLSRHGPSDHNMYFNYYAAQVMRHYGGREWDRWNVRLRDFLVATQARSGHERGSWQFDEQYSRNAGRLYNTTMAIMTLEVYYRYMPLYGKSAVELVP
ncbi:MAG: terpene cyclase/mutase family protein [Pirellulales bacterium]|nr:terpene cyclase/mutase family protein [Pirellulales bacterium]